MSLRPACATQGPLETDDCLAGWKNRQDNATSTALHSPLKIRFRLGQTEPGTQEYQLLGGHMDLLPTCPPWLMLIPLGDLKNY